MTVCILPATLLLCVLVEVHGRPSQRTPTERISKLRRPDKLQTTNPTGGVTLDVYKLRFGVQSKNNYLKSMKIFDKVLSNGFQRKEKTLVGSPQEKIIKISPTSQDSDAQDNTGLAPRCGVEDTASGKTNRRLPEKIRRRFRRFASQGSKWPDHKQTLTWAVDPKSWSTKMTNSEVLSTLTKAFRTWAEVMPLKFRPVSNPSNADIKIEFRKGYHGCQQYFDGPKGVLAHAYYPQYGGAIHFDDDEPWKTETTDSQYKSFLLVAIHEIGHSLGLLHSNAAGAIMGRFYFNSLSVSLSSDDIQGIQSIYGRCQPTKLDSIESSFNLGKTYIFKNDIYWKYDDLKNQVQWPSYPRDLKKGWPGIPNKIDEMFLWRYRYSVYFFVGKYYYAYNDLYDTVIGSPKLISQGWPGVPDDIDAALSMDSYNSYFFKGDTSYKYDSIKDKVTKVEKISAAWPGIPDNLDTAFVWYYNGFAYFFKDEFYWKWDTAAHHGKGPYRINRDWHNICEV